VTVLGSNNPTDLANTQGSGTFTLKSGKVFDSTSSDDVALVGSALASKNNLSVGSTFTAYNTTIKVVGIFDSGNTFSNGLLVLPLATLQTLSSQAGDITSAVVTADSITDVDSVTAAIKNALGSSADVTSSKDQAESSIAPLNSIKSVSLYSLIGAVIAGAIIILLTMVMIVRERRREIGVLKAIGASNLKVMLQFMTEAVTLTVLGAVVGILLGVVAAQPITNTLVSNSTSSSTATVRTPGFGGARGGGGGGGFAARLGQSGGGGGNFVAGGRGLGRVRNSVSNIHAAVGWSVLIYGLGAAIVIAISGSLVASWFIAKVRPAEVMRAE
jgi:putative ABC transport system permease protein